ncbi:hypothetical protein [Kiloniella sp. b19]|uniref:hypothetical protein n=1 Tax=Kiloniella sp. GXU_MW_B19 TaxID=3141326 RepID=UPI0031E17FE6
MTTYDDLRPGLKTGDIVLFAGESLFSKAIRFVTRSQWSHVGMVIKIERWNLALLWESTTPSDAKDIEGGTVTNGVQLVALSSRVQSYKGKIAIRQLNKSISDEQIDRLAAFRESVKGRKFEKDALELVRAAMDNTFLGDEEGEDLSSFFCSELIAESYQAMGLLQEGDKPSNEFTPADFSSRKPLALTGSFSLNEEIYLKRDQQD